MICRACDRNNIYCFGECSGIRRCESKRRASSNYQKTFKGRVKHADCEARRRARKREKVHKYNNQDHSMLTAMAAVENILNGDKNKDNIWQVNTDMEYHEEKSDKQLVSSSHSK